MPFFGNYPSTFIQTLNKPRIPPIYDLLNPLVRSIGFLELSRVSIYSYGFISLFGHQLRFQLAKHHPHPRLGILQQARYTVHGSHSGLSSSSRPSQPQKSSSSRSLTMATNIAMVLLHMPVMEVVATPSQVRPSGVPRKVDTPKPRCIRRAHACPDEMKFRMRKTFKIGTRRPHETRDGSMSLSATPLGKWPRIP
ncbi:hypothetical protein CRG98_023038 [Punica granatum]|uniref:Uncharacterized protein n=1 Tax=Punica granatum TaxID=22663 RepID=A0A2I0JJY0_PUNGR|nr:hypothetical protein CRG98_023038 [Punica granatum]